MSKRRAILGRIRRNHPAGWAIGGAWLPILTLMLLGCSADSAEECRELIESEDFRAAAERCDMAWQATADPAFGVLAARAHRQLDDESAVVLWSERLEGSAGEPEVLSNLAGLYRRRGEIDRSRQTYRRQVEAARALGDTRQEGRGSYGLFYLAWESSDFQAALGHAADTLEAGRRAGDSDLTTLAAQAIFNLRYDLGDLDGAEQALDRAEELLREVDSAPSSRQLAFRCALQLDRGRLRLAADFCRRALAGAPEGVTRSFLRSTHLNLVKIHLELGELDSAAGQLEAAWAQREPDGSRSTALAYYRARLRLAEDRPEEALESLEEALADDPVADWVWDLEYLRGRALESHSPEAAEEAYRHALQTLEALRRDLGFDELKPWLLAKRRRPFEALFTLLAEAGRPIDALAVAERAQARDFLDAFIAATAEDSTAEDSTVKPAMAPRPEGVAEAGPRRRTALDELLPTLQSSPIVAPRSRDALAREIAQRLSGRPIVMFFRAEERSWILSLGRGVDLRPLSTPVVELRALLSRWLADLENRRLAEELGQLLLPADLLPSRGPLVVVSDGELGAVPFAALRHGGRALAERLALSQVPSLEALIAFEAMAVEHHDPGGALVFGDPRGDLPAAAEEARWVARHLGTLPRLGRDASREAMVAAEQVGVLHLATHSGLDAAGPWLALAQGELGAAEVLMMERPPRLVVLASCASGAAKGRGLWGSMGGAFLAAGSSAVLVSHWSVDDRATRRFIERFYAKGGAGDPVGALARAQQASIAAGEPVQVWAAFALIGLHSSS